MNHCRTNSVDSHVRGLIEQKRQIIADLTRVGTISDSIPSLRKSARKHCRVVSAVMDFWISEGVPHLDQIRLMSYQRGTLTVHISSSSARYEFEQLIRSPDFARATIEASPSTLSRIRTMA